SLFGHDIQYVHGSFELMDNYAAELIKRGEYAAAIPYLEESIRLNPHWYRTRTNLGVAYQFLGDDKKAEEVYLDTIQYYPTPFAYGNLTTLYYNRGDYTTAEAVIRDGLEHYPNFNRLHFLRALMYVKTGRQDEALDIMQRLIDTQALDRDIREFILQLDKVPPTL
ncbi:MAG: tetratricopeptide repeat protein, partial [Patescibacteria group bacterium]